MGQEVQVEFAICPAEHVTHGVEPPGEASPCYLLSITFL